MAALMNNFVGDGNGYVGNVDLKPEVAHTISATGEWSDAPDERQRWSLRPQAISPMCKTTLMALRLWAVRCRQCHRLFCLCAVAIRQPVSATVWIGPFWANAAGSV